MEAELIKMMPHTITVAPYSSDDRYGAPTFGTAVSYTALVQQKVRQVRNLAGEERVSMVTVYVNTTAAITPKDRLTLPAGFTPQTPPIISVARQSDESGLHHTVIYA